MKTAFYLLSFLLLGVSSELLAQCADCTPDESCTNEVSFPQICPEVMPDATAGEYYETTLTFFLPPQIVDPESEITVSLDAVIINDVSGMPFGLTFQLSEEDQTYNPSQGQNFGCATVCGTPLLPGEYVLTVFITAEVSIFGIEQTANESFSQPLLVLPGENSNPSFNIDNLANCGELNVNVEALIDGSPGITSYTWDFGNGEGSDLQNPPTITYSEEGDYTISLITEITNYNLESVSMSSFVENWTGDIEEFNNSFAPDPYFIITNGDGITVYTGATLDNTTTGSWADINLEMTNPPYTISFYDEDSISDDDFLGSTTIALETGVANLNAGGSIGIAVVGTVAGQSFENEELVSVFGLPDATFVYDEMSNTLSYDDEELDSFIWFFMGDTISGQNSSSLELLEPGVYQANVTNIYGCSNWSDEFVLCPSPEVSFDESFDVLLTEAGFASYEWEYNGLPIPGADTEIVDFQGLGNYSVSITTDYGCEVESEVYILSSGTEEFDSFFRIYPNPCTDHIVLEAENGYEFEQVRIFDISGKLVLERRNASLQNQRLNLSKLTDGLYVIELLAGGRLYKSKFVKQ